MFKNVVVSLLALGFFAGPAGTAQADEIAELRELMEQQYEQMRQVQNRLIALEKSQVEQGQTIEKIEKEGFTIPETMSWIEKVTLYGDFRYRYEYRDRAWKSDNKSDRHRIRARVGLKAKINEEWTFDFRVATSEFLEDEDGDVSGGDFVSGNKSLGDYWASKNLWIDRAYASYKPKWMEGATFKAGKMGNPFYRAGKTDLIWDGDLNPEGIAFQYETAMGDADTLFINTFGGTIQENGSSSDKRMVGGQIGLAHSFEDSKLTAGAGYFDYSNVKDSAPIAFANFAGNTSYDLSGTDVYRYDYNLVELFGEYATSLGEMPVSVYGDYVVNTASGVSEDTGWIIGTTLNKAKAPGTWQVSYDYRDLEADAVFGAFTDSDFADGGTNARGHKFNFTYVLAKNTALAATYFKNENLAEQPNEDYDRLQLDLKVKF
ncbi:MAG: putative porin [Planctomycetota bacterium]|jgi:hypothetical protein